MHGLLLNLRLALRQLRRTPGFALTVVLTLALGIGAATAIFSIVEGVLLRPLPFYDPGRLVSLSDRLLGGDFGDVHGVTLTEVGAYTRETRTFASLGAYTGSSYELSSQGQPEQVQAARLTASIFPTLGVGPVLGRVFTQQEDTGRQPVAVLSYGMWRTRFHGDAGVLGKTVLLDRKPYTIIGVMPRSFEFPLMPGRLQQAQLWVPMSFTPEELSPLRASGNWNFSMVARIKPGLSLAQVQQDVNGVAKEIMHHFPPMMASIRIQPEILPLKEDAVATARPLIHILLLAVLVVLLIACANVAGLLLVRAIRRRRELAVRLALGASAGALVRVSMLEGLLLSVGGGLLGLALASAGLRVGLGLLPESTPRIANIGLDSGVMGFAILLSILTGLLCGAAPAFAALRTSLNDGLKAGGRTGTASHGKLRSALVITEIAVALVLLISAGALLRSFQKMRDVDPGFRPDHVLVAGYSLPDQHYANEQQAEAFSRSLVERLEAAPGVLSAGMTNILPSAGFLGGTAFVPEGSSNHNLTLATLPLVYGDYFRALGIPLIHGRFFTLNDDAKAPLVVIVNETLARHYWPQGDALGKRLKLGTLEAKTPWATIVGVVADTKLGAPDTPDKEQFYSPVQQFAAMLGALASPNDINANGGYITLRSSLPPQQMTNLLRSTVASLDPLLALDHAQTMDDALSSSEAPRRFSTSIITAFAAGALLLAAIGVYAVIAFSVSLRAQEMAIRMALGSRRAEVVRLVLASGARLALYGCAAGLLGALAVSRLLGSMLFNVSATDPFILAASIATMLLLTLAASAIPARRAASANPVDALRSE